MAGKSLKEGLGSTLLIFISIFFVFLLGSCRIHGTYTTNPKSHLAFSGSEIKLNKDCTFRLRSWTDSYVNRRDSLGNRIWDQRKYQGYGTYESFGDSVLFSFINEDSVTVKITKWSTKDYEIICINEIGDTFNQISNDSLHLLSYAKGRCKLNLTEKKGKKGKYFQIESSFYAVDDSLINIDYLDPGENTFKFKTYNGYYAKNDTVMLYCKRTPTGIRFGDRKRWYAKKRKWNFLNKLYC